MHSSGDAQWKLIFLELRLRNALIDAKFFGFLADYKGSSIQISHEIETFL